MSDGVVTGVAGLPDHVLDAIADVLEGRGDGAAGSVLVIRGTTPASRAALATRLVREHDAPVFRLAPEDLITAPHERMVAVFRLLDAAEVAGAVAMVDAADHLMADRAAETGLAERLHRHPGVVVLVAESPGADSPLNDVIGEHFGPG